MTEKQKYYASYVLWPVLMGMTILTAAIGFSSPYPMLGFNIAYISLIISLLILERGFPHEKDWQEDDRQLFADIAHTLTSKATVQALLIFGGVIGLTAVITPLDQPGAGIWPRDWPVPVQVILALIVAEFGLYWAHRLGHEWPVLWRFHAIHHSVTRLWIVNTGRFHFIDSLVSIVMAVAILLALGAPLEIVRWHAALTAFFGLLTHCNVEMRFGPLNYIFVTPGIHRWHHSMKLAEGNKNYGENLVLWDILFDSYINPDHRPPKMIGVPEYMPPKFIHQLLWPFLSLERKQAIKTRYPDLGRAAKAKLSPAEKHALEVEHNVELSSVAVPNSFKPARGPQAAE
ncbi:MAG: sterol desaturase family protein [Pseudomonadota bacterium]